MLFPILAVVLGLLVLAPSMARAALQFDVFLGYDDLIREANWFPIACEIHNDGTAFNGVVEITSDQFGRGQVRRVALELPTNTRKRFVVPVFGSAGRYGAWNVRLLDDHGRMRAERMALRPRREVSWQASVLGALPRSFSGLPKMPERGNVNSDIMPEVARLQVDYFPDNAIALEGLDALYLHSEKALDLSVPQSAAIVSWVAGGGHLIVSVEQPGDLNTLPWLKSMLPCDLTGLVTAKAGEGFRQWARKGDAGDEVRGVYARVAEDQTFEDAPIPLVTCLPHPDAKVLLSVGGQPAMLQAQRGRGRITCLAFSPEREPFRSWKNKPEFWARLMRVPAALFDDKQPQHYSYQSIDGVFGAMIDSKQVRKLPVSWLLLLLVVYLLVIGPIDQYSLKKLNKQMLTWITFPCYVVGFSLLIYWIGFLLRAGETEWNELHIVDVVPRGLKADLRGRTFGSVYSPSNARYEFAVNATEGSRKYATMRGEFLGNFGGQQDSSRGNIDQRGDGFAADVFVPVWTSQLCISDWLQTGESPITARVEKEGGNYKVTIENKLPRALSEVRVVLNDRVHTVGSLEGSKTVTRQLPVNGGQRLVDFVRGSAGQFNEAVGMRRQAFGDSTRNQIGNPPVSSMAASFLASMNVGSTQPNYNESFIMPKGMDLTGVVEGGQAVLLAWDQGKSLVPPLNQFTPRRGSTQTLIRLAVPVGGEK